MVELRGSTDISIIFYHDSYFQIVIGGYWWRFPPLFSIPHGQWEKNGKNPPRKARGSCGAEEAVQ
jgi:hypothetical protein